MSLSKGKKIRRISMTVDNFKVYGNLEHMRRYNQILKWGDVDSYKWMAFCYITSAHEKVSEHARKLLELEHDIRSYYENRNLEDLDITRGDSYNIPKNIRQDWDSRRPEGLDYYEDTIYNLAEYHLLHTKHYNNLNFNDPLELSDLKSYLNKAATIIIEQQRKPFSFKSKHEADWKIRVNLEIEALINNIDIAEARNDIFNFNKAITKAEFISSLALSLNFIASQDAEDLSKRINKKRDNAKLTPEDEYYGDFEAVDDENEDDDYRNYNHESDYNNVIDRAIDNDPFESEDYSNSSRDPGLSKVTRGYSLIEEMEDFDDY